MAVFQSGIPKGVNKDVNPTALPPEVYSHSQNTRFGEGAAKKFSGHDNPFPVANPSVAPYQVLNWATGQNNYWFYAGSAKIYRTDGSTHTEFTRTASDYSVNLTAVGNWDTSVFNGLPIFNNGVDDPQCLANL